MKANNSNQPSPRRPRPSKYRVSTLLATFGWCVALPLSAQNIERPVTPGTLRNWAKLNEFLARIKPADRNKRNTPAQRAATLDLYFEVTEEDIEAINARLKPHIRVRARLANNGKLYIPMDLLSDPITYPVQDILLDLTVRNNVQFPVEEETP